jgi:hypothetical protein
MAPVNNDIIRSPEDIEDRLDYGDDTPSPDAMKTD